MSCGGCSARMCRPRRCSVGWRRCGSGCWSGTPTGWPWCRRRGTWCRATRAGWAARPPGRPARRRCRSCWPRWTTRSGGCSTRWPLDRRSGAAERARTRRARWVGCSRAGCCCGSTRTPSSCPDRWGWPCAVTGRWAAVNVTPPEVGARDRGADVVDRTAGGAALEVLRQIESAGGASGAGRRRRCCVPAGWACASCAARPGRWTPTRARPPCSSSWRWPPTWSPRPTA